MTPETEQAPAGYLRRPRLPAGKTTPRRLSPRDLSPRDMESLVRDADAPVRSEASIRSAEVATEAARTRQRDAAAWPPPSSVRPTVPQPAAAATRARGDGSIVSLVPYLAVLICTLAGVYVAWHQGAAGAGRGGIVSGLALLAAAVLRLLLPARLVGLLGTRKRAIDVLTLTVFGAGLLVAGLVLPY
jgi:hypothetical protein